MTLEPRENPRSDELGGGQESPDVPLSSIIDRLAESPYASLKAPHQTEENEIGKDDDNLSSSESPEDAKPVKLSTRAHQANTLLNEIIGKPKKRGKAQKQKIGKIVILAQELSHQEWEHFSKMVRELQPRNYGTFASFLRTFCKYAEQGVTPYEFEILRCCFVKTPRKSEVSREGVSALERAIVNIRENDRVESCTALAEQFLTFKKAYAKWENYTAYSHVGFDGEYNEFSDEELEATIVALAEIPSIKGRGLQKGLMAVVAEVLHIPNDATRKKLPSIFPEKNGDHPVPGVIMKLAQACFERLADQGYELSIKSKIGLLSGILQYGQGLGSATYALRVFEEVVVRGTNLENTAKQFTSLLFEGDVTAIGRAKQLSESGYRIGYGALAYAKHSPIFHDSLTRKLITTHPLEWAKILEAIEERGVTIHDHDWATKCYIGHYVWKELDSFRFRDEIEDKEFEQLALSIKLIQQCRQKESSTEVLLSQVVEVLPELDEEESTEQLSNFLSNVQADHCDIEVIMAAMEDLPRASAILSSSAFEKLYSEMGRERKKDDDIWVLTNADVFTKAAEELPNLQVFAKEVLEKDGYLKRRFTPTEAEKAILAFSFLGIVVHNYYHAGETAEGEERVYPQKQSDIPEALKYLSKQIAKDADAALALEQSIGIVTQSDIAKKFPLTQVINYTVDSFEKRVPEEVIISQLELIHERKVSLPDITGGAGDIISFRVYLDSLENKEIFSQEAIQIEKADPAYLFSLKAKEQLGFYMTRLLDEDWSDREKRQFAETLYCAVILDVKHHYRSVRMAQKSPVNYISNIVNKVQRLSEISERQPTILDSIVDDFIWYRKEKSLQILLRDKIDLREAANYQRNGLFYMRSLSRSPSREEIDMAQSFLGISYQVSSVPYALDSEEAKKMTREIFQVTRRAFDTADGFAAITYDAKRAPGTEIPLLARYGIDIATQVRILNSDSNIEFPGRGYMLSGLRPEQFLVADPDRPKDPYANYKVAWPWAAKAIDHVDRTRYIFSRGFLAVIAPQEDEYILDGHHYSYVVYNEHFHNSIKRAAYLVPTEVLQEALSGKTRDLGEELPEDQSRCIKNGEVSLEELQKRSKEKGIPLLNLCWASNAGGLAYAYPPRSQPYFAWEHNDRAYTTDAAGHSHSSYILGQYQDKMTTALSRRLEPLREGHRLVFRTASAYQNLMDLQKLSLAYWHKGQTLTEEDIRRELEVTEDNILDVDEEGSGFDPFSGRMLNEAITWHEGVLTGKVDSIDAPILCVGPALEYSHRPNGNILLDTENLVLKTEKGTVQLDAQYDSTENLDIFLQTFGPHLGTFDDLRFYHREEISHDDDRSADRDTDEA